MKFPRFSPQTVFLNVNWQAHLSSAFFLLTLSFIFPSIVLPQWGPDTRLTSNANDLSFCYNNAHCLATGPNGFLHVVWYDNRDGNWQIYYKRSTDSGASWSSDVRLTSDSNQSYVPSIYVSDSIVNVVWYKQLQRGIYYKRSTDLGITWSPDTCLSNYSIMQWGYPALAGYRSNLHLVWQVGSFNSVIYYKRSTDGGLSWMPDTCLVTSTDRGDWVPSVAVRGSGVYMCWSSYRDGNYEIYFKCSTDSGASWGIDQRLTFNLGSSWEPAISVSDSGLQLVWTDTSPHGYYQIYFKRSTDFGVSWDPEIPLTILPVHSAVRPTVASRGSAVNVVWVDNRDGNNEIYYKRSLDGGIVWSQDERLTHDTATSDSPFISMTGSYLHVAWIDQRDKAYKNEVYYKQSSDDGVTWVQDFRITYPFANSKFPRVAASGTNIHVTWEDWRTGNSEIYYKHSTNSGSDWASNIRLTYDSCWSVNPSLATSGAFVHVVWEEWRDGNSEIYYKRSSDNGASWGPDVRLTDAPGWSGNPDNAVSGLDVHVVWEDNRDGNYEIYYKRSTDAGSTWFPDSRLTFNTYSSLSPAIAVLDTNVHIVWYDNRFLGHGDARYIFYKRSTDSGINWFGDVNLISDWPAWYEYPSVSAAGSKIYAVWEGIGRGAGVKYFFERSPDWGASWESRVEMSDQLYSYNPRVSASRINSNVHIVWRDDRDGNGEIYYRRSINSGTAWGSETRLTDYIGSSCNPSMCLSDTVVHLVWFDDRSGPWDIYYKRNLRGNVGVETPGDHVNNWTIRKLIAVPNPFVSCAAVPGHFSETFTLYDISGRKVATYMGDRIGGDLSAGVYFLRPEGKNAKPLRIVKVK